MNISSNKKSSSVDSILRSLTAQWRHLNYHKVNMATPRWFKLKTKHCLVESLKVAQKQFPAHSKTLILMCHYNHSLSIDATIVVSKNFPITGEHVGIIFVTQ